MATFFVIFSVLILVNAALLIQSSISASRRGSGTRRHITHKPEIKIYSIDLHPAAYKNAI